MKSTGRLIVVSNRLPMTIESADGKPRILPSGGGLVSALAPVLREGSGFWIGSPGTDYDPAVERAVRSWGSPQQYSFVPVFLTQSERNAFYNGFSNEIIWPLFHGFPSRCKFDATYWTGYYKATERFATAVESVANNNDVVWVHDYHLMKLAHSLRERGMQQHLGYFHHIPFPPLDVFETLPWREDVLRSLLRFDTLGFQTMRDRRNFVDCVRYCLPAVRIFRLGDRVQIRADGHNVLVGAHPISIDYEEFATAAADAAVRENLGGTAIVLGVDRLDYTKGICERLSAFEALLERDPVFRGQVTMVQIVVPSREDIEEYRQLKTRIERLISNINGKYTTPGWVPIHYLYRHVTRAELIAFYRAARVALVTPLKDGMNLVAKEFCASRTDNRGVLVLSEFAGASEELKHGALIVNPHDSEAMASTLRAALLMPELEQSSRMGMMRAQIRTHNVYRWARSFNLENAGQTGETLGTAIAASV